MKRYPDHKENLVSLKRIEGQVRGVQKMIEEGKYCVDILTQMQAVKAALARVERDILQRHIENCVVNAIRSGSQEEKDEKLHEVMVLLKKM